MTGYFLDTDVISAVLRPVPPLHLIRRLAVTPAERQFTTAITVDELIYVRHFARVPGLTVENWLEEP